MLKTISDELTKTGLPVWYGAARTLTAEDVWDYIVFYRTSMQPTGNKRGMADTYEVAIVQEEYVPDEVIQQVVTLMLGIPGMRMAQGGGEYNYTRKPNTDQIVEVLTLDFVRPSKVSCNGR